MSVLTDEQAAAAVDYEQRRVSIKDRFRALPYGSQQTASFDTREAPTTVSSVINGRIRSTKVLDLLEAWLDRQTTQP